MLKKMILIVFSIILSFVCFSVPVFASKDNTKEIPVIATWNAGDLIVSICEEETLNMNMKILDDKDTLMSCFLNQEDNLYRLDDHDIFIDVDVFGMSYNDVADIINSIDTVDESKKKIVFDLEVKKRIGSIVDKISILKEPLQFCFKAPVDFDKDSAQKSKMISITDLGDGSYRVEYLLLSYDDDAKMIIFSAKHFSSFVLIYDASKAQPSPDPGILPDPLPDDDPEIVPIPGDDPDSSPKPEPTHDPLPDDNPVNPTPDPISAPVPTPTPVPTPVVDPVVSDDHDTGQNKEQNDNLDLTLSDMFDEKKSESLISMQDDFSYKPKKKNDNNTKEINSDSGNYDMVESNINNEQIGVSDNNVTNELSDNVGLTTRVRPGNALNAKTGDGLKILRMRITMIICFVSVAIICILFLIRAIIYGKNTKE